MILFSYNVKYLLKIYSNIFILYFSLLSNKCKCVQSYQILSSGDSTRDGKTTQNTTKAFQNVK